MVKDSLYDQEKIIQMLVNTSNYSINHNNVVKFRDTITNFFEILLIPSQYYLNSTNLECRQKNHDFVYKDSKTTCSRCSYTNDYISRIAAEYDSDDDSAEILRKDKKSFEEGIEINACILLIMYNLEYIIYPTIEVIGREMAQKLTDYVDMYKENHVDGDYGYDPFSYSPEESFDLTLLLEEFHNKIEEYIETREETL